MFILSSVIPLIALSTYFVINTRHQVRSDIFERFDAIANVKQDTLHRSLTTIAEGCKALANNDYLINGLVQYKAGESETHDEWSESENYQHALHVIRNYQEASWGKLHHVFITDTDGRVVLSPPHGDSKGSHLGDEVEHPGIKTALQGQSVVTDFFGFSEKTHFHQLYMEPIKDAGGQTVVGVVIVEVVIAHQMELLASNVELGESGKIFMVTMDGQKIVNGKDEQEPPLEHSGIFQAIEEHHVVGEFVDHLGTPVLGMYLHQDEYPWVLCVEIDRSEVFAPVARATYAAVAITGVVAVILIAVSLYVSSRFTKPILAVAERAQAIAGGDLSGSPLPVTTRNELGQLTASINEMGSALGGIVSEINKAAHEVSDASKHIATSNGEIATNMNSQSGQVDSISSAMEQLSCSVVEIARKSEETAAQSSQSGSMAKEGGEVVEQTIRGMEDISEAVTTTSAAVTELGERGEQIGQIIGVINDIADQTNLLALNAAIEAARAGEAGRGFAVVADEVRKLADRTTKATDEISTSIKAIQTETAQAVDRMAEGTKQVSNGLDRASAAGQSLKKIVSSTEGVQALVQAISATTDEQAKAAEMVSSNIISVADLTRQTTELSDVAASLTLQLESKSETLRDLVNRFNIEPLSQEG